ncbi:phosphopantetheine-binding protein [Nocardia sp. CDC160]|uniref:phosphopantetheine-binding protein n=1 Tax=Nocardia sp. CDC160 TaxID=3112166 RepID=UPI002DBD74C4|nr:phosphopantetheine-binding protein [Nocardia sp. CDC160]MEC3914684.1 phosphopantetheine-binding protein [Nocardia sp. CDC160]
MSQPFTLDAVRADIAAELFLDPAELDPAADLFAAGLDSVRVLSLVERWRAAGREIGFVDLLDEPTATAWWRLLNTRES